MENEELDKIKTAFEKTEKDTKDTGAEEKKQKKKTTSGKKKGGLIVFLIGIAALVTGLVFLLFNIFAEPGLRDAEYLVEIGSWTREGGQSVIWKFTDIGKGKLTTNNFTNEYDFTWAIEDNKLKIETKWLYTLNDDYTYEINRANKTLTLKSEDKEFKFLASENDNRTRGNQE